MTGSSGLRRDVDALPGLLESLDITLADYWQSVSKVVRGALNFARAIVQQSNLEVCDTYTYLLSTLPTVTRVRGMRRRGVLPSEALTALFLSVLVGHREWIRGGRSSRF